MGEGATASSELVVLCLMVSKILACFTRAKLLKISAFLLRAVCAATALPVNGIAPVVRKYSGNMKRSNPPSSRSSATSVYCTRKILARTVHRSVADTPSPSTDPKGRRCSGSTTSSVSPLSLFWVINRRKKLRFFPEQLDSIAFCPPQGTSESNVDSPYKSCVFSKDVNGSSGRQSTACPVTRHKPSSL